MTTTAYGSNPCIGFLVRGRRSTRELVSTFDIMTRAWNGDPRLGMSDVTEDTFTSLHAFELGPLKSYKDAHGGKLDGLQSSGIGHACPWITWDLDCKEDPTKSLLTAETLVRYIMQTFNLDVSHDVFRCNLSGSKGCHVRLLNPLFDPTDIEFQPDTFKRHRAFAMALASKAGVLTGDKETEIVDDTIYDVGGLIRLPNSKNMKSGRHAVPFTAGELLVREHAAIIDPAATLWVDSSQPLRTQRFLWPAGQLDDNYRNAFAERWAAAGETSQQATIEFIEKKAAFKPEGGSFVSYRMPFETQRILSGDIVVSDGRRMKAFLIGCQVGERGFGLRGAWGLFREHILGWGMDEPTAMKQFTDGWKKGKSNLFPGAGDESL